MTTLNSRRLGDALRAGGRGIHPLEAGTGLLIECGSWLHRSDFTSRFITAGTSISDGVTLLASIDCSEKSNSYRHLADQRQHAN